jgi:hypothetical protein
MSANRAELAIEIIRLSSGIVIGSERSCFEPDRLRQYLDAWDNLYKYYQQTTDVDVDVVLVQEYLQQVDYFFGVMQNDHRDAECRAEAEEALEELRATMQYIIRWVEARVFPWGKP